MATKRRISGSKAEIPKGHGNRSKRPGDGGSQRNRGPNSSRNRFSSAAQQIGYTVDTADLLFTPRRHYLVNNNGHKVWADELKGKSIVLFIFPLWPGFTDAGDALDMIQVYDELSPMGDVEFVFVPVHASPPLEEYPGITEEDIFRRLFYNLPFPAIPLSDIQAWDGPVMKAFGLDCLDDPSTMRRLMPYWVVIDPSHTVVFTRYLYPDLFKLFGGAELHPLSHERIWSVVDEHDKVSRQERINKWDQLLASHGRDYLLSSEGNKVPVSSLGGKVIGLYFCDNVPYPRSMNSIEMVYEEAKLHNLDFEIVQINFPWHSYQERYPSANPTLLQCPEGVSWLTLPFKDPRSRKLQRIIPPEVFDDEEGIWGGDCLVIIDARRAVDTDLPYEFSGAEIISEWGMEGYPFIRPSLFDIEYKIQKREVTLQSLFPPGERLLQQSGELADASKLLSGKRVLVFFSDHTEGEGEFVSMLKSVYCSQKDVAEEDKFEVVYVSTHRIYASPWRPVVQKTSPETVYKKFLEGMPWLAHPDPQGYHRLCKVCEVFKGVVGFPAAAAFNRQGELIAKADSAYERSLGGQDVFPFISTDLERFILMEVNSCVPFYEVDRYLRN